MRVVIKRNWVSLATILASEKMDQTISSSQFSSTEKKNKTSHNRSLATYVCSETPYTFVEH